MWRCSPNLRFVGNSDKSELTLAEVPKYNNNGEHIWEFTNTFAILGTTKLQK